MNMLIRDSTLTFILLQLFFCQQIVQFLLILLELWRVELTVVHLLAKVDDTLEVVDYIEEIVEIVIVLADIHYQMQHVLLTSQRTNGINLIERILLQDNEVDNL